MKKYFATPLILAFLLPATAFSMPAFPGQIQQHLGLAEAPSCILCHGSTSGGGPVSQPFGQAMLAAGLTISGGSTLTAALDKLEADKTDSNADGTPDIEGLKTGVEPTPSKPPVEYGCGGGRIAPTGNLGPVGSLLAALTFGLFSWRASRRRRQFTLQVGTKTPKPRK